MSPDTTRRAAACVLAALALAVSPATLARKSDRNKPMDIYSGKQEGSLEANTPTILSGGVTIEQGTLRAESSRAEITVNGGEIARVVLTGSQATLRQELDDGTPMSAVANRIDYNVGTQMVVFTGNVTIEQPRGSLSGDRVVYNMLTGQVTSGGEGSGRVHMRILPKNAAPADDDDSGDDAPAPAEGG